MDAMQARLSVSVKVKGETYIVGFDPHDSENEIARLKSLAPDELPWVAVSRLVVLMQKAAHSAKPKKSRF